MLLTKHDLKEMFETITRIENLDSSRIDWKETIHDNLELIKYKLRKAIGSTE